MKSLTKTSITSAEAGQIVRAVFGSSASLRELNELTDGFFNAAYHLVLENGPDCVLKIAPHPETRVLRYETNLMRAEVNALRRVGSATNLPVPQIIADDFTRRIINRDYFLMSHLDGIPFNKLRGSLSKEAQNAIERDTGRITRQINAIRGESFGYMGADERFDDWRTCFDYMIQCLLADARDAGVRLPLPFDELYARLEMQFDHLDEVAAPQLVHWDLWDGNIFIDPVTSQITGLIDFERALWGDPLMEVCFDNFGNDTQHYLAGYGPNPLATPSGKMRRKLYNIYLYLIMIIESTYRQYETNDLEQWARARLTAELDGLP